MQISKHTMTPFHSGVNENNLIEAIDTKRAAERRFTDDEMEAFLISSGHMAPSGKKTRIWAAKVLMDVIRGHATSVLATSMLDITKWSDLDEAGNQQGLAKFMPVMDKVLPAAPKDEPIEEQGDEDSFVLVIRKRSHPRFPVAEDPDPTPRAMEVHGGARGGGKTIVQEAEESVWDGPMVKVVKAGGNGSGGNGGGGNGSGS